MISQGHYAFNGLERVIWGENAVASCVAEVERRKAKRVAIISSPSLRKASGVPDELADTLGARAIAIFDDLKPHTPSPQVAAFAQLLKDQSADLVVSLGGGTPIDTAKSALAMISHRVSDPLEMVGRLPQTVPPKIRQIACPTTLSGAEFSDLAGIIDATNLTKHAVSGFGIGPASVILDSELALHTPLNLWLSTGMRAIDHAIETLCSVASTPFTDALALEALSKLSLALRQSKHQPTDAKARHDAQMAVWLASSGLDRTPYGASHGIGHQLGAVAGVPHGLCSCALLPAMLEWNAKATQDAQAKIADALNTPTAAEGVRSLLKDLGLPARLSEVDVSAEQLPLIAHGCVENRWVKTNPVPLTTSQDIERLLGQAF